MTSSRRFIHYAIPAFIVGLALALGSSYLFAAWSAPTDAPPGGNVDAPINVGSSQQVKQGNFITNSFLGAKIAAWFGGDASFEGVKIGGSDKILSVGTSGGLKLDVEGPVGATMYCNENGNDCITLPLKLPHGQCPPPGFMIGFDASGDVICETIVPVVPPPTSPKIFDTPGDWSWTIPNNIGNTVTVKIVGGGGGAGLNSCYGNKCWGGYGGGGGAGFSSKTYTVSPGDTFSFTVADGGARANKGGTTSFNSNELIAEGGNPAANEPGQGGGAGGCGTGGTNNSCGANGGAGASGSKGNNVAGHGGLAGGGGSFYGSAYGRGAYATLMTNPGKGSRGAVIFEW